MVELLDIAAGQGELQVSPNPIVFGQVKSGEIETQKVTIANIGATPITLTHIALTGSSDFAPEVGPRDNIAFPEPPLEPGGTFEMRIQYAPPALGPDVAKLLFDYEFEGEFRQYSVDLFANGDDCIRITPSDEINFRLASIGEASPKPVIIENCGEKDLTLHSIALAAGTAPEFELANLPPELEAHTPVVLAKNSARQFLVVFTPPAEEPYSGTLLIESDASRRRIEMPIYGVGTFNNCPVAVAGARVRGSSAPFTDQVLAAPLDFLEFTASSDPDGNAITNYRWSIINAPPGYALNFQPRATVENPEIQLALVGDYVFELSVVDEHGRESCQPARITARADGS